MPRGLLSRRGVDAFSDFTFGEFRVTRDLVNLRFSPGFASLFSVSDSELLELKIDYFYKSINKLKSIIKKFKIPRTRT